MMSWITRKFGFTFLLLSFVLPLFSLPGSKKLKEIKLLPRSEIFFTQMENCYSLEIPDVEPGKVQIDLPELPLGTKFISSKKEEYLDEDGLRGTRISLWFTFSYSGNTRIPPLLARINGKTMYFIFEPTYVYENPALIAPLVEIEFDGMEMPKKDKKSGQRLLQLRAGEKLIFTVSIRYAIQVLDFKWKIPKDSIFTESERFEFAKGDEKITEFTTESKKIAKFQWQILKEGIYSLPEVSIGAISYSGLKKQLSLPQNIVVSVSGKKPEGQNGLEKADENVFEAAFVQPFQEDGQKEASSISREECEKLAKSIKRTFLDKAFRRHFAVFAGGEICSVPEEKIPGQSFTGGQKVKITERAGKWSFIECKEFSGWTKNDNIIEIK